MAKKRTTYSTEFKNEAASLVVDKNYSIPEACTARGVGYTAMRRWVRQLESERGGMTPTAKAFTSEQQQIQTLEGIRGTSTHFYPSKANTLPING